MNFIEELYYGNINPNEKRYDKDTHYAKTMRKFCDSENELSMQHSHFQTDIRRMKTQSRKENDANSNN